MSSNICFDLAVRITQRHYMPLKNNLSKTQHPGGVAYQATRKKNNFKTFLLNQRLRIQINYPETVTILHSTKIAK